MKIKSIMKTHLPAQRCRKQRDPGTGNVNNSKVLSGMSVIVRRPQLLENVGMETYERLALDSKQKHQGGIPIHLLYESVQE